MSADPGVLDGLVSPAVTTVGVRALCEFTARRGDLDLRFSPSPTGAQGVEGHGAVAARRPAHYQREVPLAADWGPLRVRGRADGWDPEARRLDEIKTHRGDLAAQPANQRALHWAQARVYGWLLCRQLALPAIDLALVYFHVDTRQETVFTERHEAAALQTFFEACCRDYLAWATREAAHRDARDAALATLAFPLPTFRAGQRELAAAVYRAARAGRCLLAQAPTGIGKTLGTLYPLLRAMPPVHQMPPPAPRSGAGTAPGTGSLPAGTSPTAGAATAAGLDKLFYLAAKTPGRRLALDALAVLRGLPPRRPLPRSAHPDTDHDPGTGTGTGRGTGGPPLPLRVLELVARDKACEHPDKACHGASCPLAAGFWDRLPAARQAAVDAAATHLLDRDTLRAQALAHGLCPYYLAQELVRWADVVVGDYHYWFDTGALLHGLTVQEGWRVGVLVDEAHNLAERARAMYSASLDSAALRAVRRVAPPPLRRPLERLARRLAAIRRAQPHAYTALEHLPEGLLETLHTVVAEVTDFMAAHPALVAQMVTAGGDLPALYFDALQLLRLAEDFGPHAQFDIARRLPRDGAGGATRSADAVFTLRNLLPAPYLAPRWAAAATAVLFSATLAPRAWQVDRLGLPPDTGWVDVPSPFSGGQFAVHIARGISTRWRDRAASVAPIVALIARQVATRPGLYLAFFSSHDYLEQVASAFESAHPTVPAWRQQRSMDEPAREAFLARFAPGGQGVGFAVLGGAFAEGIDLPGDRLIGAFVATLGLPQVNPVNEALCRRLEAAFPGRGDDYTYLYPGLQKVVQAAGRVIRTPQDRGVLHLIDDRYARPSVRALLPVWWPLPGRASRAAAGPGAGPNEGTDTGPDTEPDGDGHPAGRDRAGPGGVG